MCGRFAQAKLNWPSYFEFSGSLHPPDMPVSYNIKPTQDVAMAYLCDGKLRAAAARWWFVPHWHKGGVKDWKATSFNAKIETAHEKPTFRTAWRQNRCIIPATGYFEWTGPKGNKQPHYITLDQNLPVFFFAGLYATLRDGTQTTTILTTQAIPELAGIHPRMPVILPLDQIASWIGGEQRDYGWSGRLKTHRVARFGIKDDGAALITQQIID